MNRKFYYSLIVFFVVVLSELWNPWSCISLPPGWRIVSSHFGYEHGVTRWKFTSFLKFPKLGDKWLGWLQLRRHRSQVCRKRSSASKGLYLTSTSRKRILRPGITAFCLREHFVCRIILFPVAFSLREPVVAQRERAWGSFGSFLPILMLGYQARFSRAITSKTCVTHRLVSDCYQVSVVVVWSRDEHSRGSQDSS